MQGQPLLGGHSAGLMTSAASSPCCREGHGDRRLKEAACVVTRGCASFGEDVRGRGAGFIRGLGRPHLSQRRETLVDGKSSPDTACLASFSSRQSRIVNEDRTGSRFIREFISQCAFSHRHISYSSIRYLRVLSGSTASVSPGCPAYLTDFGGQGASQGSTRPR